MLVLALIVGTGIGVWRAVEAARPEAPTEFAYAVRVLDADQARLEVELTLNDLKHRAGKRDGYDGSRLEVPGTGGAGALGFIPYRENRSGLGDPARGR